MSLSRLTAFERLFDRAVPAYLLAIGFVVAAALAAIGL
jgi:hypothetical protein